MNGVHVFEAFELMKNMKTESVCKLVDLLEKIVVGNMEIYQSVIFAKFGNIGRVLSLRKNWSAFYTK